MELEWARLKASELRARAERDAIQNKVANNFDTEVDGLPPLDGLVGMQFVQGPMNAMEVGMIAGRKEDAVLAFVASFGPDTISRFNPAAQYQLAKPCRQHLLADARRTGE